MIALNPTPLQARMIATRDAANVFAAGGRGGGKSTALVLDVLAHIVEREQHARPLIARESMLGIAELADRLYSTFILAFGSKVSYNKGSQTIVVPHCNSVTTLTQVGDPDSYAKSQGKSFSYLGADEVGNYTPDAFRFLARLRSNLRTSDGRRVRLFYTANPHGRAHTLCVKHHISKAAPSTPYRDDAGEVWINFPSTLADNPHIDQKAYKRQLRAATLGDTALAQAWIDGSWNVLGGAAFDNFEPAFHIVPVPPLHTLQHDFKFRVGADHGQAAPSTAILLGQAKRNLPGIPYGSLLCIEETDTADPNDLAIGNGAPPSNFAAQIKGMLEKNAAPKTTKVITDDARGLAGETVVELYRTEGLNADRPERKDRVGNWTRIRQLLENGRTGDGPGLYFTNRCPHLIETITEAPRGTLRPEDLDPKWSRDHWLDGLAYGVADLAGSGNSTGSGKVIGQW